MNNSMISSLVGMSSIQQKIDSIANNMANINTVGYKSRDGYFGEILTSRLQQPNDFNQLEGRLTPKGLDLGYGSKLNLTFGNFIQGPKMDTGVSTDFMLQGENIFFTVAPQIPYEDNEVRLSRSGHFQLDANRTLVTDNGDFVLNTEGEQITIPEGANFIVDNQGEIVIEYINGDSENIGAMSIIKINTPQALEQVGNSLYKIPEALLDDQYNVVDREFNMQENNTGEYNVFQGSLEGSNVDLSKEMVNLTEAQRSYQLLSQSISISDQMFGITNNLRG